MNTPNIFTNPNNTFNLSELNVAQNINRILDTIERNAIQEFDNFLKDKALSATGDLVAQQFGNILPSPLTLAAGVTGKISSLSGSRTGKALESITHNSICDFLNRADVGHILYLEVPVNKRTGDPTGNGFSCNQQSVLRSLGQQLRRLGSTRVNVFPDFMFSPKRPKVIARESAHTYLVAELKLRANVIRTGRRQFRGIIAHASRVSYGPIAVYASIFGPTMRKRNNVERAAFNMGKGMGRPVFVFFVSVFERP